MESSVGLLEKQAPAPEIIYHIPAVKPKGGSIYTIFKRCLDIVVALFSLIFFAVPMVIIAIVIRAESPGAAIFRQERLGKNGKPFTMYKFRSMYEDAEAMGPQWAKKQDIRVTRVGRFLRNTRLDELPQLWNIFLGNMSLVGPRPERAYFYNSFETYIHGFKNRLAVKPGLTGLAQIKGGYNLLPEEKIVHDMEYIKNQSLWLDLKCIFKTLRLVITHEGAR